MTCLMSAESMSVWRQRPTNSTSRLPAFKVKRVYPVPSFGACCNLVAEILLVVESLARAQREKDDAVQQSTELKKKLESAEGDAHA